MVRFILFFPYDYKISFMSIAFLIENYHNGYNRNDIVIYIYLELSQLDLYFKTQIVVPTRFASTILLKSCVLTKLKIGVDVQSIAYLTLQ